MPNHAKSIRGTTRHACVWPAEKLASTPWLFVPSNAAVVSPFTRRGPKAPMAPAEADVAAVVIRRAKAAQHDGRSFYWLWPDREDIAPIRGVGPSWVPIWAQSKHVVYLPQTVALT